ncbi:MAG: GH92 family glycosyl hydrolase, partial [Candidatus Cryptobacteroides sp.]
MNKTLKLLICLSAAAMTILPSDAKERAQEPADYVNPFIGASTSHSAAGSLHGLGKTFPGATTPFGMVQVSPNTITGMDNSSGYSDEHTTIEGFPLTQMSGVGWSGELGNFLLMPTTGPLKTIAGKEDGSISGYRSKYDKNTETAQAGYYKVDLTDYGIRVETSATTHCGAYKITFPKNDLSRIQVDLARRVGGSSDYQHIEVIDEHTFRGWIRCTPVGGGWGIGKGKVFYTLHFYGYSSKPLNNYGFYSADIPDDWARKRDDVVTIPYLERVAEAEIIRNCNRMDGKHIGFFNEFATKKGEQVEIKVGISFVDALGAERNYRAEADGKSFDQIRSEARQMWNDALSKILVEGGTEDEKTVFYTSMYHSMIDPRIYTDVDGRYIGGDYLPWKSDGTFTKRTVFSGWDVFRSQFPLHVIISPDVINDALNSLITLAEQSKRFYFERWELLNSYSGCMLGNPALSCLADAYVKGVRNWNVEKAFDYAVNTSHLYGNDKLGYSTGKDGISLTLEYAYFDWCVSELAKALGKDDAAEEFAKKSLAYKNTWNDEVGWFCPRNPDGTWMKWPKDGRLKEGFGSKESNPYQQGWFVPHDIDGMVELMGGKEKVLADLNEFFEKAPEDMMWNKYYN